MKEAIVTVCTAPRQDCTLNYCLASIEVCGWNPIIFAEPGSTETTYPTRTNITKKGVWHNWRDSVIWCFNNTNTEYILTVQDDALFHPDCKSIMDSINWPDNAAFVSLYTASHHAFNKPKGLFRLKTGSLWGAMALFWKRDAVEKVINSDRAKCWYGVKPKSGNPEVIEDRKLNPHKIQNSDTAISIICNKLKLHMYTFNPSPVSHISRHSSINHGGNTGRRNCNPCADLDKSLIEQFT